MNYLNKILKLVNCGYIKTKYSHHNLIYRRGKKFIFSVDCSGLAEFWLKKRNPEALSKIYEYVYKNRPVKKSDIRRLYSFDFYDFFGEIDSKSINNIWQSISPENSLYQGDIIAFINPDKKGRFGHVAIIEEELYRDDTKIVVKVIDSSQIKHINDTRQSKKMGIGRGTIELYLQNNQITSICYCPNEVKIRLARIARLRK